MPDQFAGNASGLDSPAADGFAITPHDTNELAQRVRGIYVGSGGSVVVKFTATGSTITFAGVPTGSVLPIRAAVVTTASTATSMVGLV